MFSMKKSWYVNPDCISINDGSLRVDPAIARAGSVVNASYHIVPETSRRSFTQITIRVELSWWKALWLMMLGMVSPYEYNKTHVLDMKDLTVCYSDANTKLIIGNHDQLNEMKPGEYVVFADTDLGRWQIVAVEGLTSRPGFFYFRCVPQPTPYAEVTYVPTPADRAAS